MSRGTGLAILSPISLPILHAEADSRAYFTYGIHLASRDGVHSFATPKVIGPVPGLRVT